MSIYTFTCNMCTASTPGDEKDNTRRVTEVELEREHVYMRCIWLVTVNPHIHAADKLHKLLGGLEDRIAPFSLEKVYLKILVLYINNEMGLRSAAVPQMATWGTKSK